MEDKKLVYTITNPEALKFMEDKEKGGVNISFDSVFQTLQKQVDEKKEKDLLKYMYEMYKNSKFYQIYIIDEREFENFVKTMLPIYLDKRGNTNGK